MILLKPTRRVGLRPFLVPLMAPVLTPWRAMTGVLWRTSEAGLLTCSTSSGRSQSIVDVAAPSW